MVMKKALLMYLIVFNIQITYAQKNYIFIGNGLWSDSSNWAGRIIPPEVLQRGLEIFIDPQSNGECVLDVSQNLKLGSKITVAAGKTFRILKDVAKLVYEDGEVFVNASNPKFAELKIDSTERVAFFGKKSPLGEPLQLTGYSIYSAIDSSKYDYVQFDDSGRYSNMIFRTGEKLHFRYLQNDSLELLATGSDGTEILLYSKWNDSNKINRRIRSARAFNESPLNATDKQITIKVTKKNLHTGLEEDVRDDEAVVMLIFDGYPYRVTANYNSVKGLFTVPHASANITYDNPQVIDQTISLIKKYLEFGCFSVVETEQSIIQGAVFYFCPYPHPVAQVICNAGRLLLVGCYASKALDMLSTIHYMTGLGSGLPPNYNTLKAVSVHYKNGTVMSKPFTASQLYLNPNNPDIKLTHEYTFDSSKIQLNSLGISAISFDLGIASASVSHDGNSTIVERGFCWNTSTGPNYFDFTNKSGSGKGTFFTIIANLQENTKYYIRPYAINATDTIYGTEMSFTTLHEIARVSTIPVSSITLATAFCGGNVSYNGTRTILAKGICWSTSPNPTVIQSFKTDAGGGKGLFSSQLSGLVSNTLYYYRAYAINQTDTVYGDEMSFNSNELYEVFQALSVSVTPVGFQNRINLRLTFNNGLVKGIATNGSWKNDAKVTGSISGDKMNLKVVYDDGLHPQCLSFTDYENPEPICCRACHSNGTAESQKWEIDGTITSDHKAFSGHYFRRTTYKQMAGIGQCCSYEIVSSDGDDEGTFTY
jgi:hypothetical protein